MFRLTSASGGVGLMRIAYRDGLLLLMSLASLVLLIACANVANLLLARGMALGAQTSLRLALGASRGRITGHALTEACCFLCSAERRGLAWPSAWHALSCYSLSVEPLCSD